MTNGPTNYDESTGLGSSSFEPEKRQELPKLESFKAYVEARKQYSEWFNMIDELEAENKLPEGQ